MKKLLVTAPLVALLALPFTASAHEHQTFEINGVEYSFTIGSLNEPVTVDDKTGLDFRVMKSGPTHGGEEGAGHDEDHDAGMPVIGLEETLQVEMIAGDQSKITDISPVYGSLGAYKNAFYPTVATTLSYRIFGTIEGTPFDYTFTCNPAGHGPVSEDATRVEISDGVVRTLKTGSFGCPSDKADMGFPEPSASILEMKETAGETSPMTYGALALALAAFALVLLKRNSV